MKQALQYSAWVIGLCLDYLVISAMTRGTYRKYPFVFAYSLALLASTLIEIVVQTVAKSYYSMYYWYDEVILDVLVFCVVIAFIDHAARSSPRKTVERRWLILAAAAIMAASFLLRLDLPLNRRMTRVSRDLNLCAVVLDLLLWSLLIAVRRPDRRLLLLSGGLGLQLTGAIMGESLRDLARGLVLTGTLLEVVTGFLGLYIWWRALRPAPAAHDVAT